MSVYRQRRFQLLALVTLLAGLTVWIPWAGVSLEARGLTFDIEVTGGSQAILNMDSSLVMIRSYDADLDKAWTTMGGILNDNWSVFLYSTDKANSTLTVEVGGPVNEDLINGVIGVYGEVVNVERRNTKSMQDRVVSVLKNRLDPYDVQGVKIRVIGENQILVETKSSIASIRDLLTKEGRIDLFIDSSLAAPDNEVYSYGRAVEISGHGAIGVTYFANLEGVTKFDEAASGKAGKYVVPYIDLAFDAVFIYSEDVLTGLTSFVYDENLLTFRHSGLEFSFAVPVLKNSAAELSENSRNYLEDHAGEKSRVIFIGRLADYENLMENIPAGYAIEAAERISADNSSDTWLTRVCGVLSTFAIEQSIADNGLVNDTVALPVLGGLQQARDFRIALINRMPARLTYVGETAVEASFGERFTTSAALSYFMGVVGISILVYYWFKRFEVSLLFFAMLLCELLITFGAASAMHITIGMTEILSVFAVLAVGMGYLFVITYEMVGGVSADKKINVGWKAPKALSLSYIGTLLATLSLLAIIWLGSSSLWGFLIIFITGTFLSALLVNPVYVRLVDAVYSVQSKAAPEGQK